MHQYHSPMPNWSPWWLAVVWCAIIAIIGVSLHQGSPHYDPGVRHALPDPYVPQCYATEWRSGQYCEFRPVKRIGNN
jgi:hypothetical protein